jgi:phosphoglycolate phosphatase
MNENEAKKEWEDARMMKGCIFDLDGTLLNTLAALEYTTNLVMDYFGLRHLDEAHIRQFVGDGYKVLMEKALRYAGDEKLGHYEESLTVYMDYFAKHCLYEVHPYDGIPELLKAMKAKGIRIAVLSNKPHARTVENIEAIFGKDSFDLVLGEQPGIPKKPDPAGVRRILKEWQIAPEECYYVGDTNTDMQTGLGAGLVTIGAAWGFRGRAELESFRPQYVADTPTEVIEIIHE